MADHPKSGFPDLQLHNPSRTVISPPMGLLALDTFEAVKELRDLGMEEEQATAIVKIVSRSAEAHVANLATKDELKAEASQTRQTVTMLQSDLTSEVSRLEDRINLRAAELKSDLIKWMLGSQVVLLGALVALIRFADILG